MTKFFLFILLIVIGSIIGITYIFRKIQKFFKPFQDPSSVNKSKKANSKEQVVYQKDDVVVLKGEAGKNSQS